MHISTVRALAAATIAAIALATVACSGGSATPTATPPGTVAPATAVATASATPTPTPSPTSTPTPTATPTAAPAGPVITAQNAKALAPAASAQIQGFSNSAWSADGGTFNAITQDGLVAIDALTGRAAAPVDLGAQGFLLGIAPDGHTLAFSTTSGVRIWDLATRSDVVTLDPGVNARTTIGQAVFSPDGKTVALVHVDKIEVALWNIASGKQIADLTGFQTAAPVYTIRMNVDASEIAWVARATVQFMDVASGKLGARLSFEQFVAGSQFLAGGRFVTVVPGAGTNGQTAMTATTWDSASGQQLSAFTIPSFAAGTAVSPDGHLLAVAGQSAVTIWSLAGGAQVASISTSGVPVRAVSFSPGGRTLAAMLDNGTLEFLRAPTSS